jgi:hypothetical protein
MLPVRSLYKVNTLLLILVTELHNAWEYEIYILNSNQLHSETITIAPSPVSVCNTEHRKLHRTTWTPTTNWGWMLMRPSSINKYREIVTSLNVCYHTSSPCLIITMFAILSSSTFMVGIAYFHLENAISRTAFPSGAPLSFLVFSWVRVARSLVLCVCL